MEITSELINKAKLARRMTTDAYDSQVTDLLGAAALDLGIAGVEIPEQSSLLVEQAMITFFLMRFGEPDNYETLKRSYDEQKAQLSMYAGYTDWGDIDG